MNRILYILILFLISVSVMATEDGGTESPFALGAGAKHLALGSADISLCSDAVAPYWNPSGLAQTDRVSLTGFYTRLYDTDVAYQYFGFAYPTIDWGTLGIGVFRLGIDGIEKRDNANLYLGDFEDTRLAYYLAYGTSMSGYNVGVSLSIEQHNIDTYKATSSPGLNLSLGKDFSISGQRIRKLSISLIGRNLVAQSMKLDAEEIKEPLRLEIGAALATIPIIKWNHEATLFFKLKKTDDIDVKISAGLEYDLYESLKFRGGVNDGKLTAGAGIKYGFIEFDYALINRDMGALHMFNLSTVFGLGVNEKRNQRARAEEERFNNLMSEQLERKSLKTVSDLDNEGREYLAKNELDKAVGSFEKALFIAQNNHIDTTDISALLIQTKTKLDEANSRIRYAGFIDSATVLLGFKDYLGAKYIAGLAVKEKPISPEAKSIIAQSDSSLKKIASIDNIVSDRLIKFDSLMNYGQLAQAEAAIRSIQEYAPNDLRIRNAIKKIDFELLNDKAITQYELANYDNCIAQLDSALILFPGHNGCLMLKSKAQKAQAQSELDKLSKPIRKTKSIISDEYKMLAEEKYNSAMNQFKKGRLDQAITYWEEVEQLIPDYNQVRQYLIKAYKYQGVELYGQSKLSEAIEVWNRALKYDRSNSELLNYIDRSENELRKLKELSYDE